MDRPRSLIRALGAWGATSIVVGTIIGTGVFLKTATMTQDGGPLWVLVAWAVGGALSLAGAMTYAELGAMFPRAGGEYVYLREGYGPFVGYLYAWNRFWIATPGSIAAYAVGAATFLHGSVDLGVGDVPVAVLAIALFTALNCMNVRAGGRLNTALTAIKVAIIAAVAIGALIAPRGDWAHLTGDARGWPGFSAFGGMVLAALWAYDGWNNLPMAAGEVRDPGKNLPRAIVGGTLAVLAIYAVINLGYFHALPVSEIVSSRTDSTPDAPAVAAKVAAQFLGDTAQGVLAAAMVVCALSAMTGSMLTGARVPYAVATDGLAPAGLARLSPTGVPVVSVLVQGAIACVLSLSGQFDFLTNAVVFASWAFYALNAGSVILLRRRAPAHERPFRVPGFPVVPIAFVVLATLLLVNTVFTNPKASALGLSTTVLGAAVYWIRYRQRAS